MSSEHRNSISECLNQLFAKYGRDNRKNSLLHLCNRYIQTFSNSLIPEEPSIISSISSICQQQLIHGNSSLDKLNQLYVQLSSSQTTNPKTRKWMLYLLMTLHYQNKFISLSSFTIPKLPSRSATSTPLRKADVNTVTPTVSSPQKSQNQFLTPSTLPIAESLLIQDLIVTFQGIDSVYFTYDMKSSLYRISVDLPLPIHIFNTVLHLLQIGTLYRRIRLLIDQTKSEEHGIIRNSVNDNVNKQLYQFYRFVISLEETNHQSINTGASVSSFTLQKLVFQCESPLQRLTYLYNILCNSINLRGGALASAIYNFTNHGNPDYRSLSLTLLDDINRFMLKQAWEWSVNGRLLDIHAETFTEIALPSGAMKSDGTYSEDYNRWTETYHYRERMIPSFFPRPLVELIFDCGKSVHFIRDALQDHKWSVLEADIHVLDNCSLDNYVPFQTLLTSVFHQAQQHILTVYFETYHFRSMLRLVHHFFLLAAGDFYLEFISRVENGFLNSPTEVSDGWLQEEFNNCVLRTSLASSFDYISEHIHLRRLRALSALDMWRLPFFTIERESNLNVVLSGVVLTRYEQIFSMLMTLRTQSLVMERLWVDQCSLTKELDAMKQKQTVLTLKPFMDRFNLVRVKIQSFLTTLQNFYFLHVIDKLYNSLITKLQSVQLFDDMLRLHESFLSDLCRYFFVGNGDSTIKQTIIDLLECSKRFVGIQNQFFDAINLLLDKHNSGDSITIEIADITTNKYQGITELDSLFTQKMQVLITRLRNPPKGYADFVTIAGQLDFNYYYTEF